MNIGFGSKIKKKTATCKTLHIYATNIMFYLDNQTAGNKKMENLAAI